MQLIDIISLILIIMGIITVIELITVSSLTRGEYFIARLSVLQEYTDMNTFFCYFLSIIIRIMNPITSLIYFEIWFARS